MLYICFFVLLNIFADEAKQLLGNLVWKADGNSKLWVPYNVWGSHICKLISSSSYKLKEIHIFNAQTVLSNEFALLCTWEIHFFFPLARIFSKAHSDPVGGDSLCAINNFLFFPLIPDYISLFFDALISRFITKQCVSTHDAYFQCNMNFRYFSCFCLSWMHRALFAQSSFSLRVLSTLFHTHPVLWFS